MTPPRMTTAIALVTAGVALSGCGTAPEDRAISGAGIGAAGGAIIGAVTSVAMLPATASGAAVGGLTGIAIGPDLLNLGDPPWTRRGVAPGSPSAMASKAPPASKARQAAETATLASRDDVRGIQKRLDALGYKPGRPDGVAGRRTRQAIREYQKTHHLAVDGIPTPQLARDIDTEIERLAQLTRADTEAAPTDNGR